MHIFVLLLLPNKLGVCFSCHMLESILTDASNGLLMRLEFKKGHARLIEMPDLLGYCHIPVSASKPC